MRLKKIYIVHSAWFVNQAVALVKPFIKTELMSLLHFTTGGPDEIFPPEILPEVRVGKSERRGMNLMLQS